MSQRNFGLTRPTGADLARTLATARRRARTVRGVLLSALLIASAALALWHWGQV